MADGFAGRAAGRHCAKFWPCNIRIPISRVALTAAERLDEIAEILAAGLMRLQCPTVKSFICATAERVRSTVPATRAVMPTVSRRWRPGVTDTVLAQLAALKTAPIGDLKQKWRDLFDSEPPPYNRRFLEHRLAYRIQELAYGGLKPETLQPPARARRGARRRRSEAAAPAGARTGRSPARGSSANTRASSTA